MVSVLYFVVALLRALAPVLDMGGGVHRVTEWVLAGDQPVRLGLVQLVRHFGATSAGSVALEPGDVAASVNVHEIEFRRIPDVHRRIVKPTGIDVAGEGEDGGGERPAAGVARRRLLSLGGRGGGVAGRDRGQEGGGNEKGDQERRSFPPHCHRAGHRTNEEREGAPLFL